MIAAVEGGADGPVWLLRWADDLIVASEQARFTATQMTAGLTPDAGLTLFLSAGLPRWLVAQVLLTAALVTAARLYDLGVVNQLVSPGQAVTAAADLAALDEWPPQAIRTTKQLLGQVVRTSFDDQLEAEADAFATALGSVDGRARLAARLEQVEKPKRTD